ncbi:GNAT family N-acetyltransferase [Pseudalkalibacillus caeni]|uniref:GNAT family N-acetyltransferase n=1 Tax=Exobacillus caeni TaxID=2574798 RepID=A0A5R9FCF4_9BACL|nr:GNAT family N-acetyltransferase [Pseudalkalibacillus caeni]TLS38234.1 GNAT family N-acetyltransferase [Pseudalkalibacillus caeni]
MEHSIRRLKKNEKIPYELLLLADPSKEIVDSYIHRGECYVAESGEKMIGVFVLLPTRPKTVELVNIAVDEAHQRKGVGKKLVEFAVRTARKENAETIEIGTGNSSLSQLGIYQKCGFRITGIDRDFFIRHYDEPIVENGIECIDMVRLSMDL